MHSALYNDAPVTQFSPAVFDAFVRLTKVSHSVELLRRETRLLKRSQFWGECLYAQDQNITLSNSLEPFDKDYFSHGSDSAYPPYREHAVFPTFVALQWSDASLDNEMGAVVRNISDTIRAVAAAEGQDVAHAAKYQNYAIVGTPLEEMFGENVERLHNIRAAIDPTNVMGLTGGWRF